MNIDVSLAPIVLFVYNRPWHTEKTIESLKLNNLSAKSELYIYSDAPKNDKDLDSVNEVRCYINAVNGFKNITIIEREINFGLAENIVEGVSKVIKEYGRVIVLEDDIITSPYFLHFMNRALEFYKEEGNLWHISGWNYPIESTELGDTFMWRVMNCWGWATWSDRWASFEHNPERLINEWPSVMVRRFNLDGAYNFWSQVKKNYEGELNTWAIFWYATIFEKNGLCMQPSVSLVHNSGFDGTGENCLIEKTFDSILSKKNEWEFDRSFQESVVATQRIKLFYIQKRKSYLQRILIYVIKIYKKVLLIIYR